MDDQRRREPRAAALSSLGWGLLLWATVMYPSTALAYVGPGAGLSVVGSVLAVIVAILAAVLGFLWYPMKRLLRKRRERQAARTRQAEHDPVP